MFSVPMASPTDVSHIEALLDSGAVRADEIVAVLGKTEGNGGRNDFTRALAVMVRQREGRSLQPCCHVNFILCRAAESVADARQFRRPFRCRPCSGCVRSVYLRPCEIRVKPRRL